MWLINTETLCLEYFTDERNLSYAILSHRWEGTEVSFKDNPLSGCNDPAKENSLTKVKKCCEKAQEDDLPYAWIDTCCIDKSSSAELQEAINSMFQWYANAATCYVYLSDSQIPSSSMDDVSYFRHSKWFTRGWTLQELIAPRNVAFFDKTWEFFGTRKSLSGSLAQITRVDQSILELGFPSYESGARPPVCDIMSWAKGRETARLEDRAYSLMGLFDVNMPMLYGEGNKAFVRLQEEIIRNTEDQSVFAWEGMDSGVSNSFATSPDQYRKFRNCSLTASLSFDSRPPHSITNQGITMHVQLIPWWPYVYLAVFNVQMPSSNTLQVTTTKAVQACGIFIVPMETKGYFARATGSLATLWQGYYLPHSRCTEEIVLVKRPSLGDRSSASQATSSKYGFRISIDQALCSVMELIQPGRRSTMEKLTVASTPAEYQEFQFLLKDRRGVAARIYLDLPGPANRWQRMQLNIQLALLGDFNPHCFISTSSSGVPSLDETIDEGSDWLLRPFPYEYEHILGIGTPDFTPYRKERDWSRGKLKVDHRWGDGCGEVLSTYDYKNNNSLCLRGIKSDHLVPIPGSKVLSALIRIGEPGKSTRLRIIISAPQRPGQEDVWDCIITQAGGDIPFATDGDR